MIKDAKRTLYRPNGEKYVRITPEGCVFDNDMHMLDPNEKHKVNVCGEIKHKRFQRLDLDGMQLLADVVTGTIYDAKTGQSGSSQLWSVLEGK